MGSALEPPFSPDVSIFQWQGCTATPGQASAKSQQHPPSPAATSPSPPAPASKPEIVFPAVFTAPRKRLVLVSDALAGFLLQDLSVARLNHVHEHLYLAALGEAASPLHAQAASGREIQPHEGAHSHLVWHGNHLNVKPLPEYLLCHGVWTEQLCADRDLFELALGFLLSYIWLVQHESDLRLAHEKGLVSEKVTWPAWVALTEEAARCIDHAHRSNVNRRYMWGEIRGDAFLVMDISLHLGFPALTTCMAHFFIMNDDLHRFLARNLSWVAAVAVYVGLVLTAMQVGLATDRLQNNAAFQNASYGFTVFSILAPLVLVALVYAQGVMLITINTFFVILQRKRRNSSAA